MIVYKSFMFLIEFSNIFSKKQKMKKKLTTSVIVPVSLRFVSRGATTAPRNLSWIEAKHISYCKRYLVFANNIIVYERNLFF